MDCPITEPVITRNAADCADTVSIPGDEALGQHLHPLPDLGPVSVMCG
jgi:hypothetical protein